MIIGILKEIKTEENRVSMTPAGVEVMIQNGHSLLVATSVPNCQAYDPAYSYEVAVIIEEQSGETTRLEGSNILVATGRAAKGMYSRAPSATMPSMVMASMEPSRKQHSRRATAR